MGQPMETMLGHVGPIPEPSPSFIKLIYLGTNPWGDQALIYLAPMGQPMEAMLNPFQTNIKPTANSKLEHPIPRGGSYNLIWFYKAPNGQNIGFHKAHIENFLKSSKENHQNSML